MIAADHYIRFAPVSEMLRWIDEYDPRLVQLGKLAQLQLLGTSFFADACYGLPERQYNWGTDVFAVLLGRSLLFSCFLSVVRIDVIFG